jgi:hypothetical protein
VAGDRPPIQNADAGGLGHIPPGGDGMLVELRLHFVQVSLFLLQTVGPNDDVLFDLFAGACLRLRRGQLFQGPIAIG